MNITATNGTRQQIAVAKSKGEVEHLLQKVHGNAWRFASNQTKRACERTAKKRIKELNQPTKGK